MGLKIIIRESWQRRILPDLHLHYINFFQLIFSSFMLCKCAKLLTTKENEFTVNHIHLHAFNLTKLAMTVALFAFERLVRSSILNGER